MTENAFKKKIETPIVKYKKKKLLDGQPTDINEELN